MKDDVQIQRTRLEKEVALPLDRLGTPDPRLRRAGGIPPADFLELFEEIPAVGLTRRPTGIVKGEV